MALILFSFSACNEEVSLSLLDASGAGQKSLVGGLDGQSVSGCMVSDPFPFNAANPVLSSAGEASLFRKFQSAGGDILDLSSLLGTGNNNYGFIFWISQANPSVVCAHSAGILYNLAGSGSSSFDLKVDSCGKLVSQFSFDGFPVVVHHLGDVMTAQAGYMSASSDPTHQCDLLAPAQARIFDCAHSGRNNCSAGVDLSASANSICAGSAASCAAGIANVFNAI